MAKGQSFQSLSVYLQLTIIAWC